MAQFIGSVQEFHHFIGPRIRNAINNCTRKHRNERNGICEHCNAKHVLQSAHVHGRGRRSIIENELAKLSNDGIVTCDIGEIESSILAAHEPIEEMFLFLCQACHTAYDSLVPSGTTRQTSPNSNSVEFAKISRIGLWANRPTQDNHKIIRAFLDLEKDGAVEFEVIKKHSEVNLGVSKFDGHYAAMKTDKGNSHGKVFYNDGTKVRMWDRVREDVVKHFK